MPDAAEPQSETSKTDDWDAAVVQMIMADPKGRYWIERLLERCGSRIQRYAFDGDQLGMAWRDGRASIGDFLEEELERFCPDRFVQMIRERRARLGRLRAAAEKEEARKRDTGLGGPQRAVQLDFENYTSPPHPLPAGRTALDEMADAQMAEEQAKDLKSNG